MIGVAAIAPSAPGFVIVNVPPSVSPGCSCPSRARAGDVADRLREALVVEPVRVADHRHDEAALAEVDGDPEVDLRVRVRRSSCSQALSAGWTRSASIAQRATTGRYVAPISRRRRSTALMSASKTVVQCAAVSSERRMCSPIRRRTRVSGSPAGCGCAG